MDARPSQSLADQLSAAADWWREAGVDLAFTDEPNSWLADPAPDARDQGAAKNDGENAAPSASTPAAVPSQPPIGGDPANWPADLESFAAWWLAEPSLDEGGSRPRIAPRGKAGARLMILVPAPEAEDTETLLSGPQGRLLDSFLAAADVAAEDVYLAAGLPRHMAFADIPDMAQRGLGAVTLHHIGLAAPERVLVLGRDVLPLLGHNLAQSPVSLRKINHEGRSIPALQGRSLELMLQRPATRSRFWQNWLDWTG